MASSRGAGGAGAPGGAWAQRDPASGGAPGGAPGAGAPGAGAPVGGAGGVYYAGVGVPDDEMLNQLVGLVGAEALGAPGMPGAGGGHPGTSYQETDRGVQAVNASALTASLQGLGTGGAQDSYVAAPMLSHEIVGVTGSPYAAVKAEIPGMAGVSVHGGAMFAAGNRYSSPGGAGSLLGLSLTEQHPQAYAVPGVPQAIPQLHGHPRMWDPHTPSPMGDVPIMSAEDDVFATSAPGRLDRAGMRRVGSAGPNMLAMLGTSVGSMARSASQAKFATVDELDPMSKDERVRKRRRVSAQRSRVRKAMYILSLENENKLLRVELERLQKVVEVGAPAILRGMDPPLTFPAKTNALDPEATVSQTIESLNPTKSDPGQEVNS